MEQQDLHKRLLIALVLSILVFVGYSYIFSTPKISNNTKIEQNQTSNNQAPIINANNNAPQASPVISNESTIATIKSKKFIATIDKFGRISQFNLLEPKYKTEDGKPLALLDQKQVKPLEIRFSDTAVNDEAFKTAYSSDKTEVDVDGNAQSITLTQKLSHVTVIKTITFKPSGEYTLKVSTSIPIQYFITTGYRPVADTSNYMVVKGVLVKEADDTIKILEDGDVSSSEEFKKASIVSAFDRYYASLFFDMKNGINISVLKEGDDNPLAFVSGTQNLELGGYIGPKEYKTLNSISPALTDVIEYGWFTWLARPFFYLIQNIYDFVGNWGWAIVIFTIFIKILLFWPTYRGMLSMQKLKDLAPKMKDIKEKYAGDPAKMNMHMMELYKKHGANPFGGCLPILLQIPIFFALYRVLLNADELQGAPWILWINDLAKMDPYFVLPILMGATMWYQQKITPSNFTDPLQEKIFKFFPVLMTVFFITFPAGLVLYWLTNNILSIGQQIFVNRAYEKHKLQEIEAHHKKSK
ncbi:MAG: insertase [Sulfurovum sp. AS07-7]|nr:MAG: insertase [Sulfurovum sp. AS07-7]